MKTNWKNYDPLTCYSGFAILNNPEISGDLADLNAVRERSVLNLMTLSGVNEIILAIENENMVEFPLNKIGGLIWQILVGRYRLFAC